MKDRRYDVFISYRRTAYDTANLIAVKLRHAGYRVFFDVDTLTGGKFNEQLLEVIANCKDFIVVLPEHALDKCHHEDDWVRREVMCAMEKGKNIVPVMLDGFLWPEPMPAGMEELKNYQAITAVGQEFFDMAVQRLKGYLVSKPVGKWLTGIGIALGVLLVLAVAGFVVVHHIDEVACNSIGAQQSSAMGSLELLGEDCKELSDALPDFYNSLEKAKKEEDKADIEADFLQFISNLEKRHAALRKNSPAPTFTYGSMENHILSYRGVKKEELDAFVVMYNSIFNDVADLYETIKMMIDGHKYSRTDKGLVTVRLNYLQHTLNAFYYGYLGSLSLLPKSARKTHFDIAKKWKIYPNGTPLDLTQEEYEQFQMQEYASCDEEMNQYERIVNYEEQRLEQLEEQLDILEEKASEMGLLEDE